MKIVFFTHPDFLDHKSMPRFAGMLADGMRKRNHHVEIWTPEPKFFNLSNRGFLKKWLGYFDQYLVFPRTVKRKIKSCSNDTLFVFTDHALGPWVPLVKGLPHVVHCHDFLAQRSALGEINENPTSFTGKLYQNYIRRGFTTAKNYISVSEKTRDELKQFLKVKPDRSEVVYNGMNQSFIPSDPNEARAELGKITGIDLKDGYILHVGGNQWYKNRTGVLDIYNAWRKLSDKKLPLLLVGEKGTDELQQKKSSSEYADSIFFLSDMNDKQVQAAYCGANLLLFPSIAEGFGWPIAEGMASGCPVITTDAAPMTEVAGQAAFLIPVKPLNDDEVGAWATASAKIVDTVVNLSEEGRKTVIEAGFKNASRFETENMLSKVEKIYKDVLEPKD